MTAAADLPPPQPDRQWPSEPRPRFRLEPMRPDDVPEIGQIERRCFTNPWPLSAYRRELQHPEQNHYLVLRAVSPEPPFLPDPPTGERPVPRRGLLPLGLGRRSEPAAPRQPPIVGFAGMWQAFDEAHVTTIAVDAPWRGRGLGELLLAALFDEAIRRGANWLTLEVRVSNEPAQALYRKWGFSVQGTRRRYYSDNNEDAHIMWSRALSDPAFRADLQGLKLVLANRLGDAIDGFRLPLPERAGLQRRYPWETGGT